MAEHEPHRPNYAELNDAREQHSETPREQQREAERVPDRPEILRAPGWRGRGGMVSENTAALENIEYQRKINERLQEQKPGWKRMMEDPEYLREVQQEFKEQQAKMLQRDDGHIPPGGDGKERQ